VKTTNAHTRMRSQCTSLATRVRPHTVLIYYFGFIFLGLQLCRSSVPQLNLPARKSENGALESPLSTPRSGSAFLAHANSARSSTNSGSGVFACVYLLRSSNGY